MALNRIFLYALISSIVWQYNFALAGNRAQLWKPQRTLSTYQLSIRDLKYVVVPEVESETLSAAIRDLTVMLEERFGDRLETVKKGKPKYSICFESAKTTNDGGAYTILRERSRVFIRAASVEGWCNGLYAIMKDMLGARWYWDGPIGCEFVEPNRRLFLNIPWVEKPAFIQRTLYPVTSDFTRRNSLNTVYSFNHNLAKIFTADLYETQPEVFSKINGRRKTPLGCSRTDPQPNFTENGAVEIAARAALDYFEIYPEKTSYSLSINDNVLFDTGLRTEAAISPVSYFRGRPNYTDLVFKFMNRVAERVFDQAGAWQTPKGEDRFLTALAYYWTEPAPTISIHSRVMPVLTSDRSQWHDPIYQKEDKALINAWTLSGAERIATWDYYFGAPYVYPRQFNEWISQSLPFLASAGVDVFFSQLPSFWGLDGAKAWLAAELLWNPKQDTEVLLNEYYDNFFGAAAGSIRSFYETAEVQRNLHEGTAEWIKLYKDESGIALFSPEVIASMRAYIEEAKLLVMDDSRRLARVEVVSRAFRLCEFYSRYEETRRELVELCINSAQPERIAWQLEKFRRSRGDFEAYMDQYLEDDYAPLRRYINGVQSDPEAIALRVIEYSSEGSFCSLSKNPDLIHKVWYKRNFLGPSLPWIGEWQMKYRPSENFKVAASEWGSGSSGLRISDADIVSITQNFPAESKQDYELHVNAAWNVSLDNRIYIHVTWLDRERVKLQSKVPIRLPIGQVLEPVDITIPLSAPEESSEISIRIVTSRQYQDDFLDITKLDFGSVN